MTSNDHIRYEKLQYDINREAAKISALSWGKIHKYGYLTGEDILRSNQQQILGLAKFTYSPLGKAFEKEIKTIEDQGKKQVEVLKDLKPKEQTKPITHKLDDDNDDDDDDGESLKQKETYNKLFDEKLNEIREISKEMDYKSLIYAFTTKVIGLVNFIKFKGPFSLLKEIRNGDISLKMVKKYQKNLKRKLDQIKSGNPKHESGKQLHTIENVKNLFDSRQKTIDLFDDYSKIKYESIYRSNMMKLKEQGLKY